MINDIIFLLLKKGGHREPVRMTTSEIAIAINKSQQTASRELIMLEDEGMLERKKSTVKLTEKAVKQAEDVCMALRAALSAAGDIKFSGALVTGLKEGKYYLSQNGYISQVKEKLGFSPFPGTLNIQIAANQIEKRLELRAREGIGINGFESAGREFGPMKAYKCRINHTQAAIVFPERSHHGLNVLEIIAPVNLRSHLKIKDGDTVHCEVF